MGFSDPIVTSSPQICTPRFTGPSRKGGVVTADEYSQLVLKFNCIGGGSAVILVRIPLEDEDVDDVSFAFRKSNGELAVQTTKIIEQAPPGAWTAGEVMWLIV